ncbi:hypothetical protein BN1723_020798, partial [Verticillium longisporum]
RRRASRRDHCRHPRLHAGRVPGPRHGLRPLHRGPRRLWRRRRDDRQGPAAHVHGHVLVGQGHCGRGADGRHKGVLPRRARQVRLHAAAAQR